MSLPKYLKDKESVRDVSIKRETKVVRQIASGSLWGNKGDIKSEDCLIEHKYTQHKSYALTVETLNKIFEEATKTGKIPKMIIEFLDKSNKPIMAVDLVIVKGAGNV